MTLLDNALNAISRGFRVFPCNPRDKTPCLELVPHYSQQATTDPAQVRKWWAQRPDANVGTFGGTIVDVDSGVHSLEEAQTFAMLRGFPRTLLIRTGRRSSYGCQFHFEGLSTSGLYHVNGVSGEVRSGVQYGLFAGSVHPETGERYEIAVDCARAKCPENILGDFRTDGSGSRRTLGLTGDKYLPTDIWSAREKYSQLLFRAAHAPKGSRHSSANNVCYFAARGMLAGIFEEWKIFDGVIVFPGFTETEIKRQIFQAVESLYAKGERDLPKMLGDSWDSGLKAGRLALDLYPDDYLTLRKLSDDARFQRCMDGDISDFPDAVTAKNYMLQVLTDTGCKEPERIANATRIREAITEEILFDLQVGRIISGSGK